MRTRTFAVILALVLLTPVGAMYGCAYLIERQRISEAHAAFGPLAHLECVIYSSPAPFGRYCLYYVEFPPKSKLSNANVGELSAINRLPTQNELHLSIQSALDDAAVQTLKALHVLDSLDVTATSISDDGIEELQKALMNCDVSKRTTRIDGKRG